MPDAGMLEDFLAGACAGAAVFALRPDYRAMLLAVDGIVPGPGEQDSDALLQAAEELPHVAAWREAHPGVRAARRLIAAEPAPDEGD